MNRVVSIADLALVNAQLAQLVTVANYLRDVNASGTLTVAGQGHRQRQSDQVARAALRRLRRVATPASGPDDASLAGADPLRSRSGTFCAGLAFPRRSVAGIVPLLPLASTICYRRGWFACLANPSNDPRTAIMDKPPVPRRKGALGVHSLNHFAFSVPDLDPARALLQRIRSRPATQRQPPRRVCPWPRSPLGAGIHADGKPKRLQYLSFGAYEEDFEDAQEAHRGPRHVRSASAIRRQGHLDPAIPDGTPIQVVVAPKVSPSAKSQPSASQAVAPGKGAAPSRSGAPRVRAAASVARAAVHAGCAAPESVFCEDVLGLRLSDRSGDIIAFMHGAHSSDHHLVAFAKSHAPGYHHSSWDVASIDRSRSGRGAGEGRRATPRAGAWGGHVLGSNYFYYAQDPWGSWAEFSYGIDFVPADVEWPAADHPPEDSFYVWGPAVPRRLRHQSRATGARLRPRFFPPGESDAFRSVRGQRRIARGWDCASSRSSSTWRVSGCRRR